MIQTCLQCGAVNEDGAETCCFCDSRLGAAGEEVPVAAARPAPIEGNLAVEPNWRSEVAQRMEAYRARRRRLHPAEDQPPLPFAGEEDAEGERGFAVMLERAHAAQPMRAPDAAEVAAAARREPVRVEIAVGPAGPSLGAAAEPLLRARPHAATGEAPLLPVATLSERRTAGLYDAAFLLLAHGAFLGLFRALGGQFSFGKFDVLIYAAALALFYAQYFALFTVFGGATPGMLLRRLTVVSFDGSAPTPRQLRWRAFGYLFSGGTALLGFLWALWDEDHLTWQDRISQTYITYTEALPRDADTVT